MAAVIILGQARPNMELSSQSSKSLFTNFYFFFLSLLPLEPSSQAFSFFTGNRLRADCVGNLMRLSLDKALAVGNQLEVEAISEYKI